MSSFYGGKVVSITSPPLPTWTRISVFVWVITFNLNGKGDPTSTNSTASIARRIILTRKPCLYEKVRIASGGN
jgi:hypothetical protein